MATAPQTPKSINGTSCKAGDPTSDQFLIDRCLKGEVEAWEQLYLQCQPALMMSIRLLPSFQEPDPNLVEEIAARVWFSLTTDGARRLARFDKNRGCRISTYLTLLARDEAKRYFRSEERRRKRERLAIRPRKNPSLSENRLAMTESVMADFIETLTPGETVFYKRFLASSDKNEENRLSSDNTWQLRRRIYRKLLEFLEQEQ